MTIHFVDLEKSYKDRFDFGKFLAVENSCHDSLTSFILNKIKTLPVWGEFKVTVEEGRPEFISWKVYGDTQYFWVLLEYNDLVNTTDLKTGMTLKLFRKVDIDELFFQLTTSEIKLAISTSIAENSSSGSSDSDVITSENTSDADDHYTVTITIPSDVWAISHPLNKTPTVDVYLKDEDGNEYLVSSPSVVIPEGQAFSTVIISFAEPQVGRVVLN
jgi:hypothetical protein